MITVHQKIYIFTFQQQQTHLKGVYPTYSSNDLQECLQPYEIQWSQSTDVCNAY